MSENDSNFIKSSEKLQISWDTLKIEIRALFNESIIILTV